MTLIFCFNPIHLILLHYFRHVVTTAVTNPKSTFHCAIFSPHIYLMQLTDLSSCCCSSQTPAEREIAPPPTSSANSVSHQGAIVATKAARKNVISCVTVGDSDEEHRSPAKLHQSNFISGSMPTLREVKHEVKHEPHQR